MRRWTAFFLLLLFNPAMSEPQRQLKFRSVFLTEKESNLLHEDSSWNVLTYPGKQAPGTKSQAAANVKDLSLFECGRKVENHRCRRGVALTLQKGARDPFFPLSGCAVSALLKLCLQLLGLFLRFSFDFESHSSAPSVPRSGLRTISHLKLPRFCWDLKISAWIWFGFNCRSQNKLSCSNNPSGWLKLQI